MWVNQLGPNSWNRIMRLMPGKSEIKCHTRWLELSNAHEFIGPWTPEEDKTLAKLVEKFGASKWSKIAKHFPGRERK